MTPPYEKLLTPLTLRNGLTLKNRVTSPNAIHGLNQGPETYPAEPQINEAAEFCSSGAALFSYRHYGRMGGGSFGNRALGEAVDKAHIPICDYDDPAVQNYVCQLPVMAHMFGSKILVKLEQAFPDGYTYGGGDAYSMFPPPPGGCSVFPAFPRKKLTREDMEARICPKEYFPQMIDEMVQLLKKYKSWGYDGMSFRCDRYIDASTNLRTDEYGGEIENRARFTWELFGAIKKELGPDFIIEGAMPGAQDHGADGEMPHGYTLEETIRFAKMMNDRIDILQIREHTAAAYHPTGYNSKERSHKNIEYCRAIKDAGVTIALSANAGFVDPEDMDLALQTGACDLISAGRAFIAEPNFMKKVFEYPNEQPVPCILCNKCHGTLSPPWLAICSVNPKCGIAHRLPAVVKPPMRSKKVAVIGGGPIGMRTACFAAEKGHSVTLYEKTGYLGGKLKHADLYDFKWPLRRYRLWLIDELARRGVTVQLNTEPDPDQLRDAGFDAIIACTGSLEARPPVPGADAEGVITSEDVYESRVSLDDLGQKIVIVGGSSVGTETGMYLAQQGKDVTVLCRQRILAEDAINPHDGLHMGFIDIDPKLGYGVEKGMWAMYPNFTEVTKATTTAVTSKSVTYVKDGQTHTIDCDTVIVNGGYSKCKADAMKYVGCAPEFYIAGDVEDGVGDLQNGNVSALGRACML